MNDFWSQWPGVILGAEGDDDSEDHEDPSEESEDGDDPNSEKPEGSEEKPDDDDIAKLRKALAAERRLNKKVTRENNRFKAAQQSNEQKETSELEQTKNELAETQSRTEKLAAGLLKRDIDAAIERAARKLNFLDPDDAINGVDRSKIVFDQDDEDPTDIEIEFESVETVVKSLATKKPHFISKGTDDGEPSGSAFGGSKKRKPTSEEQLRSLYPSL